MSSLFLTRRQNFRCSSLGYNCRGQNSTAFTNFEGLTGSCCRYVMPALDFGESRSSNVPLRVLSYRVVERTHGFPTWDYVKVMTNKRSISKTSGYQAGKIAILLGVLLFPYNFAVELRDYRFRIPCLIVVRRVILGQLWNKRNSSRVR